MEKGALERIETTADHISETIGIEIQQDSESLEALRSLGASIKGERVRISGQCIREYISGKVPTKFVWKGGKDEASIVLGDDQPVFAPVYGLSSELTVLRK